MEMIAERELQARTPDGSVRTVIVRLGKPYPETEAGGEWGCPIQIIGLDDDDVFVAYGYDGVQALQLALEIIGARLAHPRSDEAVVLTWLDARDLGFPYPGAPKDPDTSK